jgi:hypothetical protein
MKKNTTVEELARLAWESGSAKKAGYAVVRDHEVVELFLRNNLLVKFRVTGYQQGVVEFQETKTKAQEVAAASFINYWTGAHE